MGGAGGAAVDVSLRLAAASGALRVARRYTDRGGAVDERTMS